MGVVSDAIDSLEDWCRDLMKDGIKSQFDDIASMMNDTFSKTTGSGGLINTFLAKHPAEFTGSTTGTGSTIWTTIETLCNNVVVPLGGFILVVVLLSDLIKTVINGNNFKDFDDSIFVKWIIKALCGVILVSNTYYIASALFSFGTDACAKGITTLFGSGAYLSDKLELKKSALTGLNLGELMSVWFISLIVHLGIIIMLVAIVIVLASRIIEVFMFLGISPIPMATMMDSGEWSTIGKNWIKQLLALSFQGFFIVIALPKDLNDIKQKFMFNLTKRQVVSFSIGFVAGVPLFFLTRNIIGLSGGIILMGCCAAPALICGLYQRNGMYFEQVIKNMFRFFKKPKKRVYRTTNLYECIERQLEYDKLRRLLRKIDGGKR